jgi:hypothetical protein
MQACYQCGAALREGARFCSECGTSVQMNDCPKCHVSNRPDGKFCRACGTDLKMDPDATTVFRRNPSTRNTPPSGHITSQTSAESKKPPARITLPFSGFRRPLWIGFGLVATTAVLAAAFIGLKPPLKPQPDAKAPPIAATPKNVTPGLPPAPETLAPMAGETPPQNAPEQTTAPDTPTNSSAYTAENIPLEIPIAGSSTTEARPRHTRTRSRYASSDTTSNGEVTIERHTESRNDESPVHRMYRHEQERWRRCAGRWDSSPECRTYSNN